MKLKIAEYEVEINARYEYRSQANDEDTMDLLNKISLWAGEAAEKEMAGGFPVTASRTREAAANIYDELAAKGYYTRRLLQLQQTSSREGDGDVEMP